jgi:putative N6-adenine-specific DNA methylase
VDAPLSLFAACLPGLEPLLAAELRTLGVEPRQVPGGAEFAGPPALLQRAHRELGVASHVVVRLAQFPCRALGELERKATKLSWQAWLRGLPAFAVRATARGSRVYHTGAVEERLRNAVAQALGDVRRTLPPAAGADAATLAVRFVDDVCTISLDPAATPLHRRGYRLATGKAPLREDLAHALLLAAQWQPGEALLDPFCGAGTIAIEAAAYAAGLPPGRLRPSVTFLAETDPLGPAPAPRLPGAKIAASDRDAGAMAAARANAQRAGLAERIEFATCAVSKQPWLAAPQDAPPRGIIVTNPPFGRRVPGVPDLRNLYQTLGHRLRALGAGWRVAILAHDPRLARSIGLPLKTAFATRHGGLNVAAMVGPSLPSA